jgi:hypothetical protein
MTESPKTKLIIAKAPKAYKLNPEKLVGAPPSVLPPLLGAFYYTEDYEYFDLVKPYLDIPEPRKSLEEIKQELDEKFEKLIETTKWKFAYSKEGAEKRYNTKFDKIFDNFEYAKRNGYFLQYLSFTTSGNASIGNGIVPNSYLAVSGSLNSAFTSNFVIKPNGNDVGYWEIQPNIQVYRKTKPNRIVRYFTKLLLDFTWKDV